MRPADSATGGLAAREQSKPIKCVVWDLDDTLWDGILLEEDVNLRPQTLTVVETLDDRGILQSIASRNDHDLAIARLTAFGLGDYFLYPRINWGAKSASVQQIADDLNIATDSLAFVDDQPFEREEVRFFHPEVLCLDGASDLNALLELPRMKPRSITAEQKHRRVMYQESIERQKTEESFAGPQIEFLESLNMVLQISPAVKGDLERLEELTERTHQLNSTGYTYSFEELDRLRQSSEHLLLVAEMSDKFGRHGKIGLALLHRTSDCWTLKLLIVSCRVISYGIGSVFLQHVMAQARDAGVRFRAEFRPNGRNRIMHVAYRFAGLTKLEEFGRLTVFEDHFVKLPPLPTYIEIRSVGTNIAQTSAAGK